MKRIAGLIALWVLSWVALAGTAAAITTPYRSVLEDELSLRLYGKYADGFTFHVMSPVDKIVVIVTAGDGEIDPVLAVVSPAGAVEFNYRHRGPGQARVEIPNPASGTWQIIVSTLERGRVGTYRLNMAPQLELTREEATNFSRSAMRKVSLAGIPQERRTRSSQSSKEMEKSAPQPEMSIPEAERRRSQRRRRGGRSGGQPSPPVMDVDPGPPRESVAVISRPAPLPQFPWPPPKASSRTDLDKRLIRGRDPSPATLGAVDDLLSEALASVGYDERSYYRVPQGYAMVTRLEQINEDGTPKAEEDRWAMEVEPLQSFDLGKYFKALLTAQKGEYRVIGFIVTSRGFEQSDEQVTREQATQWLSTGHNRLPPAVRAEAYSADHRVSVLIYEFHQAVRNEAALLRAPGRLNAGAHLNGAGVLAALGD